MSREYYKRILVVWSIVVLFMAYICASAVTLLPNSAQIQSIYFIVEPTDSVAASSSSMSLRGGAGYVMADGGVAFSVYFNKSAGRGSSRIAFVGISKFGASHIYEGRTFNESRKNPFDGVRGALRMGGGFETGNHSNPGERGGGRSDSRFKVYQ